MSGIQRGVWGCRIKLGIVTEQMVRRTSHVCSTPHGFVEQQDNCITCEFSAAVPVKLSLEDEIMLRAWKELQLWAWGDTTEIQCIEKEKNSIKVVSCDTPTGQEEAEKQGR